MIEHTCEPPIGPSTPDAWECSECARRWVRREPRDPETLLSWRKVGEGRVSARCPWCRLEGCWAFAGGAEVDGNQFTPPKGHTVRSTGDDSAHRTDTCPVRTPESRLYDPRPPWAPEETAVSTERPDIRAQQLAQARGANPDSSDYPDAVQDAWNDLLDWEELPAPEQAKIAGLLPWIASQEWTPEIATPVKHQWKRLPNGSIDDSAHDVEADFGGHNGPRCEVCGTVFCKHCTPDRYDEECPGIWVE